MFWELFKFLFLRLNDRIDSTDERQSIQSIDCNNFSMRFCFESKFIALFIGIFIHLFDIWGQMSLKVFYNEIELIFKFLRNRLIETPMELQIKCLTKKRLKYEFNDKKRCEKCMTRMSFVVNNWCVESNKKFFAEY